MSQSVEAFNAHKALGYFQECLGLLMLPEGWTARFGLLCVEQLDNQPTDCVCIVIVFVDPKSLFGYPVHLMYSNSEGNFTNLDSVWGKFFWTSLNSMGKLMIAINESGETGEGVYRIQLNKKDVPWNVIKLKKLGLQFFETPVSS